MTASPKRRTSVFLNISYDAKFERLYLAFITGLTGLGLDQGSLNAPRHRTLLGLPGGPAIILPAWGATVHVIMTPLEFDGHLAALSTVGAHA